MWGWVFGSAVVSRLVVHTDEMYMRDRTYVSVCMLISNSVTHTVNPNDRYKMKYVTI